MAAIFNAFLAIRKTFWPRHTLLDSVPQARISDKAPITVSLDELPSSDCCYFESNQALPSPSEVLERAAEQGIDTTKTWRPDPARFPEKRLIVKWGVDVTIGEGQCLWFIGKHLSHEVPVPKVYGWTVHNDLTFLYLELVDGEQLAECWDSLTSESKINICQQLSGMIASWRRIRPPTDSFTQLSQIGGQGLRDIHFSDARLGVYPAGPFKSIAEFHDTWARLSIKEWSPDYGCAQPREQVEELRGLSDDVDVVFTHADLDLSNILISKDGDGSARIVAIIDWHQSGWYPEPWEWCKARVVAIPRCDWVTNYLGKVLDPAPESYFGSWDYVSMSTI